MVLQTIYGIQVKIHKKNTLLKIQYYLTKNIAVSIILYIIY